MTAGDARCTSPIPTTTSSSSGPGTSLNTCREARRDLGLRGGDHRSLQRLDEGVRDVRRTRDRLDLGALKLEDLLLEQRQRLLVDEDRPDRVLRPDRPGDREDLELRATRNLRDLQFDLERSPLAGPVASRHRALDNRAFDDLR